MDKNINPKPKPGYKKPVSSAETAAEVYAESPIDEFLEPADFVPEPEISEAPVVAAPAVNQDAPPSAYAVVGGADQDPVYLDRCSYKHPTRKKSLSVHHVQRRLVEWGYSGAYLDKDGYYGDHTLAAVKKFQEDHDLAGDGLMNSNTLKAIFEGDNNVKVVIH